mmetsp:Transcript_30059/g.48150  ORF Transcript_30059/g.48150 Transcript_30059/m.48150 type:complete len:341 (-) Transcript_30059:61-1083(-)
MWQSSSMTAEPQSQVLAPEEFQKILSDDWSLTDKQILQPDEFDSILQQDKKTQNVNLIRKPATSFDSVFSSIQRAAKGSQESNSLWDLVGDSNKFSFEPILDSAWNTKESTKVVDKPDKTDDYTVEKPSNKASHATLDISTLFCTPEQVSPATFDLTTLFSVPEQPPSTPMEDLPGSPKLSTGSPKGFHGSQVAIKRLNGRQSPEVFELGPSAFDFEQRNVFADKGKNMYFENKSAEMRMYPSMQQEVEAGILAKLEKEVIGMIKDTESSFQYPCEANNWLYKGKMKPYSKKERALVVKRYREKRSRRNFKKRIRYACRRKYAINRPRVGGRFAKSTPKN